MKKQFFEKMDQFRALGKELKDLIDPQEKKASDETEEASGETKETPKEPICTRPEFRSKFDHAMVLQGQLRKLIRELYMILAQIDDVCFFIEWKTSIGMIEDAVRLLELGNYGKQR